jgi:serine/threonine protein kinase
LCGEPLGGKEEPTPFDSWVGVTLGRYEIQRVVASGGMGVVYAARDPQLGRTIALKLLRDDLSADDEFRRRFVRESRSAASLDHPNILPVFDAGEIDGILYIATRLVDARDLRHLLAEEGQLPVDRALSIVSQIASALDFAHTHGMVHRDVKPANILVLPGDDGDPDHAYLIDFGITKQAADPSLTRSGMFIGTPDYVAPEQASGLPVDGRADQYALACVLHHCLVGTPPFGSGGTIDILQAHRFGTLPRVTDDRPDLPESIETALLRALSKDREARFMSCRAFVAAARAGTGLDSYATPRPQPTGSLVPRPTVSTPRAVPVSSAAPPPPPRPPGRKRVPSIAIAAVALALLAAGGVAAGMLLGHSDDETSGSDPVGSTSTPSTTTNVGRTTTQPKPKPTPRKSPSDAVAIRSDGPTTEASLDGYSVRFPSGWNVSGPDEMTATRVHTEAALDDGSLSVFVDHITSPGFDALGNREALERQNPDDARYPGYRQIGLDRRRISGTVTAYGFSFQYTSQAVGEVRRAKVMLSKRKGDGFVITANGFAVWRDLEALADRVADSIELIDAPPPPPPSPPPSPPDDSPEPEIGDYSGNAVEADSGGDQHPITMTFVEPDSAVVRYERGDVTCRSTLSLDEDDLDADVPGWTETVQEGGCTAGVWRIDVDEDGDITADWEPADDDETSTDDLPPTIHANLSLDAP